MSGGWSGVWCECSFNRCTDACGTHSLWRHTKKNAKVVLTYSETHVMKHMHCDAIPVKTRMRLSRRSDACKKNSLWRQPYRDRVIQRRVWNTCIVTQYRGKRKKEPYPIQSRMWNTCIMMQYRGNAKCVLTDLDTRGKQMQGWSSTEKYKKAS